jgi:monodictyphenone polyketide synthase
MDMTNLVVTKALVAKKSSTNIPQLIQVTARTVDIHTGIVDLTWQNVEPDGSVSDPFATANIVFGNSDCWLSSWSPIAYLIHHRIDTLKALAAEGRANCLSRNMAYTLFAKNLVDYTDTYRGMQSVVMHELEAFAEIELSTKDDGGKWTIPPFFIDSVAHLAGFIMNCSDAIDTKNKYCVTSGWKSMRFAETLVPGARYRSYVKMIPTKEDPSVFLGDVYILRVGDGSVIGMVGGMHFRSFPRILLGRFFSSPQVADTAAKPTRPSSKGESFDAMRAKATLCTPESGSSSDKDSQFNEDRPIDTSRVDNTTQKPARLVTSTTISQASSSSVLSGTPLTSLEDVTTSKSQINGIADKALALIAQETDLELSELEDGAEFTDLGIDSLMSLVLAEKFKIELNVKVNGSLFLDYPTIGDLREWLEKYYG